MLLAATTSNSLCPRGALAFRCCLSMMRSEALCRRVAASRRPRSLHFTPPEFHLPLSTLSTTRLKQHSGSSEDSSRIDKAQPTWTFTPYQPTSRTNNSYNNSTRRFSASSEDWVVPSVVPIPEESLQISFARSSGAGGQNVNKLNTRVEIRFHVDSASWIPAEVRERLKTNEANRINNEGYFSITCQEYRTQAQNRKEAFKKLQDILKDSWKRPKIRKMRKGLSQKTKENRRDMKRRVAEKKAMRKSVDF
ncbi:hypothetical protein HJC23_009483 [Cyclotella cryptica]|uniref:Prokaryotic-type class I peptide chain release factors domain-containing protein n=1 Tax=Cyclotella cryptica TaxID=29204 RepID=A0ABD3P6L1_9STRA